MAEFPEHPKDCFCNPNRDKFEGRTKPAEVPVESTSTPKIVVLEPKLKPETPFGLEGKDLERYLAFQNRGKNGA